MLTDNKRSIEKSPLLLIEYSTIQLLETFLINQEQGKTGQIRKDNGKYFQKDRIDTGWLINCLIMGKL